MGKIAGKSNVNHYLSDELIAWLDQESAASGRSKNWLVEHAVKLWRRRLEYSRAQAGRKAKAKRAG